jgi:hypothetical protein
MPFYRGICFLKKIEEEKIGKKWGFVKKFIASKLGFSFFLTLSVFG